MTSRSVNQIVCFTVGW